MHLYKRGSIYWIRYMVNGVLYQQSLRTKQKSVAEAWLKNITLARKMPTFDDAVDVLRKLYQKPAENKLTLDDAWEKYVELARAVGKLAVAAKTIADRHNIFERLQAWIQKRAATVQYVEQITGAIAAGFAEHLAATGAKSKTRKNNLAHLSAIWKLLEKTSPDIRNPWENLAPRDIDSQRLEPFTPDEEERVLAAAARVGKDWLPVCIIARHTGLRYGDVATLKWSEIDLDALVIRRRPNKTRRHNITVTLPIVAPVAAALKQLERRSDDLFPLHAALYGRRGRNVQKALNFREVLTAAGIDDKLHTFHSWRHTAATRLADAGADIETRKRILGHREDLTAERYDHAAHLAETRAALERAAR